MLWKPLHVFSKWSAARIADGVRIYAIGDVHGCRSLLDQLLALIEAHIAAFPTRRLILVFLGDYIDRGPTSSQVIDQLILLRERNEVIFLKGNHESYLVEFLKNPAIMPRWFQYGGLDTLRSYGITPSSHFDPKEQEFIAGALSLALNKRGHLEFLDHLKISFLCEDFFLPMRGCGLAFLLINRVKKIFYGYATTFFITGDSSAKSLCTDTRRWRTLRFAPTGSTSIPVRMRPDD